MRWVAGVLGALLVVGLVVIGVGALLPVAHTTTLSRSVSGTPEEVWKVVTDLEAMPTWRPGIEAVERLPDREGRPVWRETGETGPLTLEVVASEEPRRMTTRIADEGLPFGGTWTYELEPAETGTRVTITERGEVYHPLWRFMSRFVFGHEGTVRDYLDGLEGRMSRTAAPLPAPSQGGAAPPGEKAPPREKGSGP